MTITELISLSPLITLGIVSMLIMISIAFKRSHTFTYIISLIGFAMAIASLGPIASIIPVIISPLFIVDSYSLFYMAMILGAAFVITLLSHSYWHKHPGQKEEYYILLFIATMGAAVLTIANHFVSVFLGIELLSVSLYAMVAYLRSRDKSIEAGVKFLVLAGMSSSFLLFGMGLVYAGFGKMGFEEIGAAMSVADKVPLIVYAGFAMIFTGIGFKLALVPFHMWTPDVYEGAPAPVTAFIASVSKGGVFAFVMRFFISIEGYNYQPVIIIFTVIAIASMFTGNFLALLQNNIKRILAYSSITHFGYLLIALLSTNASGLKAGTFYMFAYIVTIIGAFGIITVLSPGENDTDNINDYKGLFWRRPWVATLLTTVLFSLAGVPLTIGFFGKFYLLTSGMESYLFLLIVMLVLNSAISIYYYLKIVVAMFSHQTEEEVVTSRQLINPKIALGGSIALIIVFICIVWFGINPSSIFDMIESMVKI